MCTLSVGKCGWRRGRPGTSSPLGQWAVILVALWIAAAASSASAQMHAVCSNCGDWYQISATGFGLDRSRCDLCGACCDPDNFRDDASGGRGEGERGDGAGGAGSANGGAGPGSGSSGRDAVNDLNDALDAFNPGSAGSGGDHGSNVPRDGNTRGSAPPKYNADEIANDLNDLLNYLNTGKKSEDLQGNNAGRYNRTR